MNNSISPKYQMQLITEVDRTIWSLYGSYVQVRFYMEKWLDNYEIKEKQDDKIDLLSTLHSIPNKTLLKIAIDLGIETPDYIPSMPTFKNELKIDYTTAYSTFVEALKQVETNPSTAIGLANSALESIIKEILKDDQISQQVNGKETLHRLIKLILKEFRFLDEDLPVEIKTIVSGLISTANAIEKLRSEKTNFHGKTNTDYMVTNPLYAKCIINSVATVGLFLIDYYKNEYINNKIETAILADFPF